MFCSQRLSSADRSSVLPLPACQWGEAIEWQLKLQREQILLPESSTVSWILARHMQVGCGLRTIACSLTSLRVHQARTEMPRRQGSRSSLRSGSFDVAEPPASCAAPGPEPSGGEHLPLPHLPSAPTSPPRREDNVSLAALLPPPPSLPSPLWELVLTPFTAPDPLSPEG